MSKPKWRKELETGVHHIDDHHRELFALDTMLDKAVRHADVKAVEEIIHFLEHYVVEHFAEEEELMKSHNFHGYEHHRGEHSIFQMKVAEIRHIFDHDPSVAHSIFAIRQFIDKLVYHIKTVDIKIATIVNKTHGKSS